MYANLFIHIWHAGPFVYATTCIVPVALLLLFFVIFCFLRTQLFFRCVALSAFTQDCFSARSGGKQCLLWNYLWKLKRYRHLCEIYIKFTMEQHIFFQLIIYSHLINLIVDCCRCRCHRHWNRSGFMYKKYCVQDPLNLLLSIAMHYIRAILALHYHRHVVLFHN